MQQTKIELLFPIKTKFNFRIGQTKLNGMRIRIKIYLKVGNRAEKRMSSKISKQIAVTCSQKIKSERTRVAYSSLIAKSIIFRFKTKRMLQMLVIRKCS